MKTDLVPRTPQLKVLHVAGKTMSSVQGMAI